MIDLTAVGNFEVDRILQARVAARRPQPPEPPSIPPPEVRARPATRDELGSCQSARRLYDKAFDAGWTVIVSYARGPLLGSNGDVLDIVDSLLLRFVWDSEVEAAAHWTRRTGKSWALETAMLRGRTPVSGNDLAHWLVGTAPARKAA